ncbi:MAG: sodium/solute symporter [Verrucomicrobiales bacterium]|nr:sodium/solute symporter [Verrucomicrobiales bacterium]
MSSELAWQDHTVLVLYLTGMIVFGVWLGKRRKKKENKEEDYFLAGRRMPWFAVGISVIASILSSITYLSEPGEVWRSGVTHITGKLVAIPFEMLFVWLICIPFLMRFKFTSAYEYLGKRFGNGTRKLGVGMFLLLVVLWMGFVVLASARVLVAVTGFELWAVIATVGLIATIYTMLGGMRAVIWTDVIQVALLIGGGLFTIFYVMAETGTGLTDWMAAANQNLEEKNHQSLPIFSFDPTVRATVVTVAFNMFIWHVCTHLSNQMTVQRYFSTKDPKAARRSFITGSLFGVGINLMLVVTGLALLYFYFGQGIEIDGGLDPETRERDQIFPTFAVNRLPAGLGGAILAALLAAAMSSIDSGINSIATVITVETKQAGNRLRTAMGITLGAGLFITIAAWLLDSLPAQWGIVDSLPRTFNAVTAPLGGMFLAGMFLPRVGQKAAICGAIAGMMTSVTIGYFQQIGAKFGQQWPEISFNLVMPAALFMTLAVALLVSFVPGGKSDRDLAGLTIFSRK